jgi:predicted N-acetyltransferase YhbS
VEISAHGLEIPQQADCLYIHDLAVHPLHRGKGLGRSMVFEAKKIARNSGFAFMSLVAVQGSSDFWQRFNFVIRENLSEKNLAKLHSYGTDVFYMEASLIDLR